MAITPGGSLNSVTASVQQTLASNYIDFTSADTAGWHNNIYQILWKKKLKFSDKEQFQDFFHK